MVDNGNRSTWGVLSAARCTTAAAPAHEVSHASASATGAALVGGEVTSTVCVPRASVKGSRESGYGVDLLTDAGARPAYRQGELENQASPASQHAFVRSGGGGKRPVVGLLPVPLQVSVIVPRFQHTSPYSWDSHSSSALFSRLVPWLSSPCVPLSWLRKCDSLPCGATRHVDEEPRWQPAAFVSNISSEA